MGQFFRQRHPWIMQAIGGLIALIVFAPVAAWVFITYVANAKPEQAAATYAPPQSPVAGAQSAQTPQAGTTGGNAPTGAKTYTIKMQPGKTPGTYVFSPASLTIHAGDVVHWVDVNSIPHNIVGLGNATSIINRPAVNTDPYTVSFSKPGTYHYECQVHLPSMVGVITVLGPSKQTGAGGGPAPTGSTASTVTWTNVHKIFAANCVGCHVGGSLAGLNLDTYANAMKGGSTAAGGVVNGSVIKPGDAAGSYLYQAVAGKQTVGAQMPLGKPPLPASDIQTIYKWIQGGAKP